jgi:hypothetical protein
MLYLDLAKKRTQGRKTLPASGPDTTRLTMTRKVLITLLSLVTLYFAYDRFFGIDPNSPDCFANRTFYKKTMNVDSVPADVSDIRCYSDHLGADFAEEISFECDSMTFLSIATTFKLNHSEYIPKFGRILYRTLRSEIDTLKGLTDYKQKRHSPYHSFWYNPTNRHAYFLTYSL